MRQQQTLGCSLGSTLPQHSPSAGDTRTTRFTYKLMTYDGYKSWSLLNGQDSDRTLDKWITILNSDSTMVFNGSVQPDKVFNGEPCYIMQVDRQGTPPQSPRDGPSLQRGASSATTIPVTPLLPCQAQRTAVPVTLPAHPTVESQARQMLKRSATEALDESGRWMSIEALDEPHVGPTEEL